MPDPPALSIAPCASTGNRNRSEQGRTRRKARDARCTVKHYKGWAALASPHYTLGVVDEKQMQIHFDPPVPEKFA